ncbi:MAG: hypothetical protein LAT67_01080 [Balneolales bacterium]|nr:hypothetical protein [Balneolales bacterium]
MKNLFSAKSVATLVTGAFLLGGCAGISDANLSEAEADQNQVIITEADFNSLSVDEKSNGEVIFRDGEEMTVIIRKPDTDDDR